jgi:hypothetical protein
MYTANPHVVLHSINKDDRAEAAKRPRIHLPHTKAPYVQTDFFHLGLILTPLPSHIRPDHVKTNRRKSPWRPSRRFTSHPLTTHPDPRIRRRDAVERPRKEQGPVKLSTIVQPDDLEAFFIRYAEVCKTSMLSLRKRDRRKRKADKGKKKKGADTAGKKG